jgi:ATP adenylyltransferase
MEENNIKCCFCNLGNRVILDNEHSFAILDEFPVTKGHTLIIPKRHISNYFEITEDELLSIHDLIIKRRKQLMSEDATIEGFNIGINSGEVAGQTIFHLHVHLIPRRKNDYKNPKGGVRGVIPDKMSY